MTTKLKHENHTIGHKMDQYQIYKYTIIRNAKTIKFPKYANIYSPPQISNMLLHNNSIINSRGGEMTDKLVLQ